MLRLSFRPTEITANGEKLAAMAELSNNGYKIEELADGDFMVSIRHDKSKDIIVSGDGDKQTEIDDSQMQYSGQWQLIKVKEAIGGSVNVSNEKDATVCYTFTGNQVRLLGSVAPDGGWADVYLDGKKQLTLIDCWSPSQRDTQLLYYRSGLENKQHELKIVVCGKGNLISKGSKIYVDALQFSNAEADRNFGAGGGTTETQRMIFGYPLRKDYIDSKGNTWRPATEWIIRSGYGMDTVDKSWWIKRRSMYIGNTPDQELYRYGAHGNDFWANITVGEGEYYVRLKFADTPLHPFLERNKEGGKISHTVTVKINDKEVISKMNITKEAGGDFLAVDKLIKNIKPENGIIEVWFLGSDEYGAAVQAMEVGLMSKLKNE